jgi:hypothetical protein
MGIVETDSDWSESIEHRLEKSKSKIGKRLVLQLVSKLVTIQQKKANS